MSPEESPPEGPERPSTSGRDRRRLDDRYRIYLAKAFRAVAYGALSGFLFLYLEQATGLSPFLSLLVASLTLVGSAVWSFAAVAPLERRFGRRRTLQLFSGLFVASALLLYLTAAIPAVIAAVILGGVAASTADNGPLAALDQAILPSTLRRSRRAEGFAWYNLIANFGGAAGALLLVVPGALAPRTVPLLPAGPHPWIGLVYLLLAVGTLVSYLSLTPAVESPPEEAPPVPLSSETRGNVRALAGLFGLDAFAGGMVINPVVTAFFVLFWGQSAAAIGGILFAAGTVAGFSFLLASRLAERFGLLPTMVFTHLPSNVLLMLVPLMPSFPLAIGMFLARMSLSQMDVPTRQTYSMNMVPRRERPRVSGALSGARGLPQSAGPFAASALLSLTSSVASAFYLGGALKVVYDLLLWQRFRKIRIGAEP